MEVAVAATVGAVVALVIWTVMQPSADDELGVDDPTTVTEAATAADESSSADTSDGAIESNEPSSVVTQPLREQADLEAFVDAFTASRTGTYRVTGRIQMAQAGTDDTNQVLVSIVRRGSDVIEQSGTSLLVSLDGKQQSCERPFGADLVCGEVIEPPTAEVEAAALADLFVGDDPDYLLYDDQPGCWQLVATANPAPAQWGQATTICFDAETGAIERQTTSSVQGTRTFVAETLTAEVTDDDLVPPAT